MGINKTFIQISRFDQILADLHDRVSLPEFAVGSKLPSERQLATEYQCSQATMNKVISTLISEDLLERTEKRGAFIKEAKSDDLTLMGWMASQNSGVEVWKRLVEDFQALSDVNFNVNTQTLHYSKVQKEIILLSGKGEAPDVAQISRNWTGRLSSLGLLESLEGKLSENLIKDHLTWADDNKQSNHQLKSIDYGFVPMLLYINCDLLKQCGLDSTNDPETHNEFMEMFVSQIMSRQLDLMARALRLENKVFYTIGSSGHEGNVMLGRLTRHTDPAFLHYRSSAGKWI